jgi:hypothetical protein
VISLQSIQKLNELFRDILTPGGSIYLSEALPAEDDEPGIADLPRLIVDFNRRDFGKLRGLIDVINSF